MEEMKAEQEKIQKDVTPFDRTEDGDRRDTKENPRLLEMVRKELKNQTTETETQLRHPGGPSSTRGQVNFIDHEGRIKRREKDARKLSDR